MSSFAQTDRSSARSGADIRAAGPDLGKFFNPSSIALIGATEDMSKFGGRCLKQIVEFGYGGRIYPVNPKYATLRNLRCYPRLIDLPETPDHVGIVVAAERALEALQECAQKGVRFVTILSSNFSETGTERGRALQEELRILARNSGIRFMGPNCNGFINFVDGFAMTSTKSISGPRKAAGNVALVGHSGGLAQANVMWRAQEAGLGINYQVSCGNEADLDVVDFLQFMIEDPSTDVVMMAVETIRDGRKFEAVAKQAADCEKPIVILKFGRTELGRRAAASHTGAVTGADAVFDTAFRQYGVTRVTDCNELYEVAKTLRRRKWPRGNRAAALSGSGGHAVLVADLGASVGIDWPTYTEKTNEQLKKFLPGYANVGNPTDLTSAHNNSKTLFQDVLKTIEDDDNVDFLMPILVHPTVAALEDAMKFSDSARKPVAVLWTGYCPEDARLTPASLVARGVPVYRDAMMCLKAVKATMDYATFLERHRQGLSRPSARPAEIDAGEAKRLMAESGEAITERVAKRILACYGLDVTRETLARNAGEAVRAAEKMRGPVAMKIESADVPHKTEAGAIRLGVQGEAAVRKSFDEVLAAAKRFKPQARIEGVLVQEMVDGGLEVMLGVLTDPAFGPVVVAAIGGIFVEVLKDVSYRVAPVNRFEAQAMLAELRAYPLLQGARGTPPRDIDALCDAIVKLSWLAEDLAGQIGELDINPIAVLEAGKGARVVDALFVRKAAQ